MKTINQQRGFSLVESLVAFLIIVFGIVGVAALQSVAISGTKVAADRSTASIHTSALFSRIRGNDAFWQLIPVTFDVAIDEAGAITDIGGGTEGADLQAENTDCAANVCTSIQTASYNLRTWAQNGTSLGVTGGFADRLSAPSARVRRIGNDFPVMLEVALTWNESRTVSGAPMASTYYTASGTPANSQRDFTFTLRARP